MRCFALFSVVMFLTAPAAWAQAPVRLTLDEALMRGLDASHRLAEIGARQEAAQAVEDQRKAAARPQAALQAGYARTNHVQEFGSRQLGRCIAVIEDMSEYGTPSTWPRSRLMLNKVADLATGVAQTKRYVVCAHRQIRDPAIDDPQERSR